MCPQYGVVHDPLAALLWEAKRHREALRRDILLHGALYSDFLLRFEGWRCILETALGFDKPLCVVETGAARDNGSTFLLHRLVHETGGSLHSVDQDEALVDSLRKIFAAAGVEGGVHLTAGDSVRFLEDFSGRIDLLYLDSHDLDWLNPDPSSEHHLRELMAAAPKLADRAIVAIDDTPRTVGFAPFWTTEAERLAIRDGPQRPGKGTRCMEWLKDRREGRVTELIHEYQVAFLVESGEGGSK